MEHGTTWAENALNQSCIAGLAKRFETPDFLLNCSKASRHLKMNFVNFNLKTYKSPYLSTLLCSCGVWRLCGGWLTPRRHHWCISKELILTLWQPPGVFLPRGHAVWLRSYLFTFWCSHYLTLQACFQRYEFKDWNIGASMRRSWMWGKGLIGPHVFCSDLRFCFPWVSPFRRWHVVDKLPV